MEGMAWQLQYEIAGKDFLSFLEHVWILEPPPGKGRIRLEVWPHLRELGEALVTERQLVVLKSRQIGWSWLLAAHAAWQARFQRGSVNLMISRGEKDSQELLEKAKYILKNLPEDWRVALSPESRSEVGIPAMESKILALPSTEDAGRGLTATSVKQDEADFHEYLPANIAAVKPTVDAGGQIVMGSTANKRQVFTLFKEVYRKAPENGWKKLFIPWTVRPGRDEGWYRRTRESIPEIEEMDPDLYMEQNYPTTENEALSPSKALAVFDAVVLQGMERSDVRTAVERVGAGSIYQQWMLGSRYVAGSDTGHGVGGDYSVTVVMDRATGYVAADLMSNSIQPDEFAYQSGEILRRYKEPLWGIEDNDWGQAVIEAAQRMGYRHIYKRKTGRGGEYPGWHTDGMTRPIMWSELREAVNARQVIIPNARGLAQFYSVIYNPDKGHRPEAVVGAHDDYPTAVAIAWQMRKHVYASGSAVVTVGPMW